MDTRTTDLTSPILCSSWRAGSVSMPRNAPTAPDAVGRGELVRLAQVPELDSMLEVAEEPVAAPSRARSSSPTNPRSLRAWRA